MRGGARRCVEVHRDAWRGAQRGVWRSLATIDLVGDSREFEV